MLFQTTMYRNLRKQQIVLYKEKNTLIISLFYSKQTERSSALVGNEHLFLSVMSFPNTLLYSL